MCKYCDYYFNLLVKVQMFSDLSCMNHIGRDSNGERNAAPPMAHFVVGCVDRSGSMSSMEGAPSHQIHQQMKDLSGVARELDVPTYFTLVTFDDMIETPIEKLNLLTDSLPTLSFIQDCLAPRGMTKLYESGIQAIALLNNQEAAYRARLSKKVLKLNPVIKTSYVLLTDGADNLSEYGSRERHSHELKNMREKGTMAIFLGANIDAPTTGESLGFSTPASIQMAPTFSGAHDCLRAVSRTLTRASTGSNDQSITFADDPVSQMGSVSIAPVHKFSAIPPQMPLTRY